MSNPIEVSKKAYASFEGEKWNAMADLLSRSDLEELTAVQRLAHLAWWYNNEVLNGGHDQYFVNKDYFVHSEVISALHSLGAVNQSNILREALIYLTKAIDHMPNDYDEFIAWDKEYRYGDQMSIFDNQFYNCRPDIDELLENYLATNESEFIQWVP